LTRHRSIIWISTRTVAGSSQLSVANTGPLISSAEADSVFQPFQRLNDRTADGGLGPVQQAFQDCHGLQCGFCTPGFITTITAYLREHPDPTGDEAREAIGGNLCRCTGYQNIVASVLRAAELSS